MPTRLPAIFIPALLKLDKSLNGGGYTLNARTSAGNIKFHYLDEDSTGK